MPFAKRKLSWGLARAAVVVLLAVAIIMVWTQRQFIHDWYVVQSYQPTQEVEAIADRLALTDKGKFLLRSGTPALYQAHEFNEWCERREPTGAILGCYANGRIYLFAIANKELYGIKEVTAAHEMLHAAWERLSDAEHQRLGGLLDAAYQKVKTSELEARIAYYERTTPTEVHNELHSILGTEATMLSPELEQYYSRYFHERGTVVALHESYSNVFRAIEERTEKLHADVERASASINADVAAYNSAMTQLNAAIAAHNAQFNAVNTADAGEVARYNATRQALIARAAALDVEADSLATRSRAYDAMLAEYNATVLRAQQLQSSIDSMQQAATLP